MDVLVYNCKRKRRWVPLQWRPDRHQSTSQYRASLRSRVAPLRCPLPLGCVAKIGKRLESCKSVNKIWMNFWQKKESVHKLCTLLIVMTLLIAQIMKMPECSRIQASNKKTNEK